MCLKVFTSGSIPDDLYVHIICSSHMMKDFTRKLKEIDAKQRMKKEAGLFSMHAFVAQEKKLDCFPMLAKNICPEVEEALQTLQNIEKEQPDDDSGTEEEPIPVIEMI